MQSFQEIFSFPSK